jgi:hypothetical protein
MAKRDIDVEQNIRRIGLKARKVIANCDLTIEEIAEKMGLPNEAIVRVLDATGDIRMIHMDTLIRLFHACGYTVELSFNAKPPDAPDDVAPKKKAAPVVEYKDEVANPKTIAKREREEKKKAKVKGTSRTKKRKI